MTPRPQLSLCIPVSSSETLAIALLSEASGNLQAFFKKFPLIYEVLFALNPEQDQSRNLLQSLAEKHPQIRIVENPRRLGRAQSFERLFCEARGDILITTDLDLAAPLSEVFKILEALYSDRELDVVFGDRFSAPKKPGSFSPPRSALEDFFSGVIKEKKAWAFKDPFCPVLGLRRTAYAKIQTGLQSRGWHWTPEVQRLAQLHGLKTLELPLTMSPSQKNKPPKSEAWHLLGFVLFRV